MGPRVVATGEPVCPAPAVAINAKGLLADPNSQYRPNMVVINGMVARTTDTIVTNALEHRAKVSIILPSAEYAFDDVHIGRLLVHH